MLLTSVSAAALDPNESLARLQRIASLIDDLARRRQEPEARRLVLEQMREEIQASIQPLVPSHRL